MFDRPGGAPDREHRVRPPTPTAAPALPPTPAQVLSLQRTAGNRAVARLLAARADPGRTLARADAPSAPSTAPTPPPRVSYVFLMGDMSDSFYGQAKEHFEQQLPGATMVRDTRTLAEVIAHVNTAGKPVETLYIVSHGFSSGDLMFSIDAADLAKDTDPVGGKTRTEFDELKAANAAGTLPPADTTLIDDQTKIEIKGCSVGRSELMLDELDVALGGKASVTAPTHAQQFEPGAGGVVEEAFGDLFLEEPGVAVKSAAELAVAFGLKYPMVPEEKWPALLSKIKTQNRSDLQYNHAQQNPPDDDQASVLADEAVLKKFPEGRRLGADVHRPHDRRQPVPLRRPRRARARGRQHAVADVVHPRLDPAR